MAQHNKGKVKHREHELQKACVKWFEMQYPRYVNLLFAVPNGAYLGAKEKEKRAITWNRLKAEGAKSGVSDLILALHPTVFIEMKTEQGDQTANQKEFEKAVTAAGHEYLIIRSVDQFIDIVRNKMNLFFKQKSM